VCAHDDYPLVTDVYLKDSSPRPVIVIRGNEIRCRTTYPANADYHLVVQDIRPVSGIVGDPNFLHSADQDDGQALLEQIANTNAFPWCDGHIAMEGFSNAGIVSYLAAPNAPVKLRGIEPSFATGDLLNYGFFNGGVLHHETADLYVVPPYYPSGPPWEGYADLPIWDRYLIKDTDAAATQVAGFHHGGWFDVFGQGALDSFSRLLKAGNPAWRNRQKVVIGPWVHGGAVPTTSPIQIVFPSPEPSNPSLSDYDTKWKQCVYGVGQTPCSAWEALPPVQVYHMGAPSGTEWRTYTTWPPAATPYPLYLASQNALVSGSPIPTPGSKTFTSDPNNPCPTLGGTNNLISLDPVLRPGGTSGPYDQRAIEARQDVAVFTSSASGPTGTLIVGRIYADVWIQTSLPDVDVFVRMTDVHPFPDGRSILMAQGIQRARYRNGVCPASLNLNRPTRVRVDLGSTALVLPQGHSLRVIVSAAAGPSLNTTNPPLYDVNPQNGDEFSSAQNPSASGSITIWFGTGTPSALVIPVPSGQTLPPDLRPNTTPCPP
jgi:predicted acyl esterase